MNEILIFIAGVFFNDLFVRHNKNAELIESHLNELQDYIELAKDYWYGKSGSEYMLPEKALINRLEGSNGNLLLFCGHAKKIFSESDHKEYESLLLEIIASVSESERKEINTEQYSEEGASSAYETNREKIDEAIFLFYKAKSFLIEKRYEAASPWSIIKRHSIISCLSFIVSFIAIIIYAMNWMEGGGLQKLTLP